MAGTRSLPGSIAGVDDTPIATCSAATRPVAHVLLGGLIVVAAKREAEEAQAIGPLAGTYGTCVVMESKRHTTPIGEDPQMHVGCHTAARARVSQHDLAELIAPGRSAGAEQMAPTQIRKSPPSPEVCR